MENYKKTIRRIVDHKIDSDSLDRVKSSILSEIESSSEPVGTVSILDFLFGWAEIVWLRRSMVIASLALVMIFVVQQFTVLNRLGSLEQRMMGVSTESIIEFQKENMHLNSVLYIENSNINPTDSVKVSNHDLVSLLRSYRELQKKLRDLEENSGTDLTDKNRDKLKL